MRVIAHGTIFMRHSDSDFHARDIAIENQVNDTIHIKITSIYFLRRKRLTVVTVSASAATARDSLTPTE